MNSIVIIITFLVTITSGFKDDKDLMTKDYLLMPTGAPTSFLQISHDFTKLKYLDRPETSTTINVIKIKHLESSIHLYWFTDQSKGTFHDSVITRSTNNLVNFENATPNNSSIYDLDIHPILPLVYLATREGGLVEYDTNSLRYQQLIEGTYKLLKLDYKNNLLYYMDCSNVSNIFLGILDLTTNSVNGSYTLDSCYSKMDIDFETKDIYLAKGKSLYRTTLEKLINIGDGDKIANFEKSISSMVLGSSSLYLVEDDGRTIYTTSRTNNEKKSNGKFYNIFTLDVYEGPDLKEDPTTAPFPTTDSLVNVESTMNDLNRETDTTNDSKDFAIEDDLQDITTNVNDFKAITTIVNDFKDFETTENDLIGLRTTQKGLEKLMTTKKDLEKLSLALDSSSFIKVSIFAVMISMLLALYH